MNECRVTIEDESDAEMTPDRHLTILVLAMQKCLEEFPEEERQRLIEAMPEVLRK